MSKKALVKPAKKQAAKKGAAKPAKKRASAKKTDALSNQDKEAFKERVKKAMHGRDVREVVHAINNEFPDLRTLEVNERVQKLVAGKLFDESILIAIENIED